MTNGTRKLLLADDSPTIQKVVSLTFSDEGFEVVTVSDGEAALREIEAGAPDVILADVFMPKPDGYEVCARVKRDARFRHIPVVLLVGTFEPFDEAEARRVGADDSLTKPFQSIRDLVNKVGGLLGGRTGEEHDTQDTTPPAAAGSSPDARAPADAESLVAKKEFASVWDRDDVSETWHGVDERDALPAPHTSSSFADLAADDATITATPAEGLGDEHHSSVSATSSAPDVGETITHFGPRAAPASDQQSPASPPVATDADALLDLGGGEPPVVTAEAEDFILDLSEETVADPTSSANETAAATRGPAKFGVAPGEVSNQSAAPSAPPADYAGAFAEASHGEAIEHSNAPQSYGTLHASEERHAPRAMPAGARPRDSFSDDAEAGRGTSAPEDVYKTAPLNDVGGAGGSGEIRADQLTPEAIELIARRAVEILSEEVVREVAREVVPRVAERIIKRQLDEDERPPR